MKTSFILAAVLSANNCHYSPDTIPEISLDREMEYAMVHTKADSWQDFLRHLPTRSGKVLDYTGVPVRNQEKHAAIINFDVGTRDLQQCADALIRLRAEYLFQQQQYDQIVFQFTSGHHYSWKDYCNGLQPRIRGNRVQFVSSEPRNRTYASLRAYLDIVYTYAGTQSLSRQLKPAIGFSIGTVIIKPGSPGHCCIIIDEATLSHGTKVFKLAESFMPAQSIYVLKNPLDGSPWYTLKEGTPLHTSSYLFTTYMLCKF